jgi:hypothetical protein
MKILLGDFNVKVGREDTVKPVFNGIPRDHKYFPL